MLQNLPFVVLAVLSALFLMRMFPRREERAGSPELRSTPAGPYHAVSVHTPAGCCQAAAALEGQPFLSNEAPLLPLAECSAARCHCVYQHHADRRSGDSNRRAMSRGVDAVSSSFNRDRRTDAGRREVEQLGDLTWARMT